MQRLCGIGLVMWLGISAIVGAQETSAPPSGNSGLYVLPSDDEPVRPRRSSAYVTDEPVRPAPVAEQPLPPLPAAPTAPQEMPAFTPPVAPVASHSITPEPARNVEPTGYAAPAAGIDMTPVPALLGSSNTSAPVAAAPGLPLAPRTEATKTLERPATGGTSNTVTGVAISLGLVLGLFLLFAWFARSSLPQGMSRLPTEVIEPLGRMPILGRQELHLLRLGNKLVLMAISPTGMEPIAEVTDPVEVDRLLGLCRRTSPGSSTAAFREVVAQVGAEPTRGGFAGQFARAVPGTTRRS